MVSSARTRLLRFLMILSCLGLIGRLAWIQSVRADEILRRAEQSRLITQEVAPQRGTIRDRNGEILAFSAPAYAVYASPKQMNAQEKAEAASLLGSILQVPPDSLQAKLDEAPDSGYLLLQPSITVEQKIAIEKKHPFGTWVETKVQRSYPHRFLANQVLGYVDAAGHGQYGLEARYDAELSGKPGHIVGEFTYEKTPIEGTVAEQVPPVPGRHLILALDAGLQRQAEHMLETVVKEEDAKRAAMLVMDVRTGELLVMAMRPAADPGDRSTWGDPIDFDRINNWTVTTLSPGSIFKVVTTAAALEEQAITLKTTFLDSGKVVIDGWTIRNWDKEIHTNPKPVTIAELLQQSSNVGMIQVGNRLGKAKFLKHLENFGFMEKTGIDLSDEGSAYYGDIPFDKKRDVDWANMYIGQHLQVTPVQMITAVAAVANGGYLVQPHLARSLQDDAGQTLWTAPTAPRHQVISTATAREMQGLLKDVVAKGSGNRGQPAGYTAAGKTGTAEKFTDGIRQARMLATFAGFAPADDPRIAVLVLIDEPKGEGYGGQVAAPLFAEMVPNVLKSLGVSPEE